MKLGLLIFLLAFLIRFINLLFLDLNVYSYLLDDQKFYWEWSLKSAYLPWSELSNDKLSERMPGIFWFYHSLQWLTDKNLFLILIIQSLLDSVTCVIICKSAALINKRYELLTGLFAAFSPLMIVVSSQILSDTIFLFVFTLSLYFLLSYIYRANNYYFLFLSALFLGLSAFVRAVTFPLVFLSIPVIYLAIRIHNYSNKKVLASLIIFLLISLIPVSYRLFNNIITNETYSLTSQSGSHVAYWMVPSILSLSKGMDRSSALDYVNSEITKAGGLVGESYKDSNKMMEVSKDILSKESIFYLSYGWLRSSILNIVASPILLDQRIRSINHTSYTEQSNILRWVKKLFSDKDNSLYLNILILSIFSSCFVCISLLVGFFNFIRTNSILAVIAFFIIIYFCLVTGPIISPKYAHPYIPIILFFQAITIDKLIFFIKKWYKN